MNQPMFEDCLTAPLHFSRAIQPHGALIVVDHCGRITGVSANAASWLGAPHSNILGHNWDSVFPDTPLPFDTQKMICQSTGISAARLHPVDMGGKSLVMAWRPVLQGYLLEFEAQAQDIYEQVYTHTTIMASCVNELPRYTQEDEAAKCLMHHVACVTGFDRVMLMKFLPDRHCTIVAEQNKPGLTSFLHQHFPANDIPENARRLYRLKHQRLIADANDQPIPIQTLNDQTIDLTFSELRAVHPAHIQYMRNMGTRTSFSVSVVVNGALWGLISCHNLEPASLSFAKRLLCEQLAGVTSLHMTGLARMAQASARHAHTITRTRLKQTLQSTGLSPESLQGILKDIAEQFKAKGVVARLRKQTFAWGSLPGEAALTSLRDWLGTQLSKKQPVFQTNEIPACLHEDPELVQHASGLMHIAVNADICILLLRPEQREEIDWAGNEESIKIDPHQTKLSPRASFAVWHEQVRGKALPWSTIDIEAAYELRNVLVELIDYLDLEHKSLTDPLTRLGNRNLLQQRFKEIEATEARGALLLIDLDNFKPINDTFGHAVGDKLLMQIAHRLRTLFRAEDTLVRLGGDEFAIVLSRLNTSDQVEHMGQRLAQALAEPYLLNGIQVKISASVGAALFPQHGSTSETLIHHADMAMYQVKRTGRNGFMLYADMHMEMH